MSSLLCSSDAVAAISLIKFEEQPKLFSMVFGEGITNDAVSIILFNTVYLYTSAGEKMDFGTPFKILGNFLYLGFFSLIVGIFMGISNQ
jgi:NhaP-type Na+/H+ or K+/H+ antiporter